MFCIKDGPTPKANVNTLFVLSSHLFLGKHKQRLGPCSLFKYQPGSLTRKLTKVEVMAGGLFPSAVLASHFVVRRLEPSLSLINIEVEGWCTHDIPAHH